MLAGRSRRERIGEEGGLMRVFLIALLSLVVGAAAGVGHAWIDSRSVQERFLAEAAAEPRRGSDADNAGVSGTPKLVVVGGESYDFGVMRQDAKNKRPFRFRNDGDAPLEISKKGESCGLCVETEFVRGEIMPGETLEVPVTWTAEKPAPKFEEFIEFDTNDPKQSVVRLTMRGLVTKAYRVDPDRFSLGDVSANDANEAKARIYASFTDKLQIVGHEFTNQDLADLFEVTIEPLSAEDLKGQRFAKSGVAVLLTVEPGLPSGLINQSIRLTTNSENDAVIDIPIEGKVVSDISIVGVGGAQFDDRRNVLIIRRPVRSDTGAKITLRLLVRGTHPEEVSFQIGDIEPRDVLQASVGARIETGGGPVQYPLTVEIPKGARPINRLGTDLEKNGKILIETTHPHVKQIVLYVRFAVQG